MALAQAGHCPEQPGPWVQLIFAGPYWSDALREGVTRELRVELARRELGVCAEQEVSPEGGPVKVVTLLAADDERVSIVGSNLQQEGGFTGRTILVSAIPEDARALAIAQAVDEALRNESAEPAAPPPPRVAPPIVQRSAPEAPRPSWFIGAALAPTVQVAPGSSGRQAVVAPGVAMRLSVGGSLIFASLGVAVTRAGDLSFESTSIRDFRVPVDASLGLQMTRGSLRAALDFGLLAALASYELQSGDTARNTWELGGRAGLRIGWGRRIIPWVGTSIEFLPRSTDLRLIPTGSLGSSPAIWLGFALGTEVRWP